MDEKSLVVEGGKIVKGEDMELVDKGYIVIGKSGKILNVESGSPPANISVKKINAKNCVVLPSFIDAHTHIGDSVAKDAGIGKPYEELVKPPDGLKHRILTSTPTEKLIQSMRESMQVMLSSGISVFADFREGGVEGVEMLHKATRGLEIKPVSLGRPAGAIFTREEIEQNLRGVPEDVLEELVNLLRMCDGLGISGTNAFTDLGLRQLSDMAKSMGKIVAIHTAENTRIQNFSFKLTRNSDVERALKIKPTFLVHLTKSTIADLDLVAKERVPVVACPRCNGILGEGIPPIDEMLKRKIVVGLGTDNVMLNPPDLFREMEYVSIVFRAFREDPKILPMAEILKMATINGAKILGLDKEMGSLDAGKRANLIALDFSDFKLKNSRDPIATVVHRAGTENIKLVMVDGKLIERKLGVK
jgi:cytosine/adenosine deaminase-related metal-dependent hydrolase